MEGLKMQAAALMQHWQALGPFLAAPRNKQDYDALVERLDAILDATGDDEAHPLASLASAMGDLIEAYDEKHHPMPAVTGAEALRYLMAEHKLTQRDVPEIGAQSVVSEVLAGKREINKRQALALSERFGLPATVFL